MGRPAGARTHRANRSRGSRLRGGFTVIEIAVVALIFSLLIAGVANLLLASSQRFVVTEQAIVLAMESAALMGLLRSDTDGLLATEGGTDTVRLAEGAAQVSPNGLAFRIASDSRLVPVSWSWQPATRSLRRELGGAALELGRGMVATFTVIRQLLGDDGVVRSEPADPEAPGTPAAPAPARVVRVWYKVFLGLEGAPGHNRPPVRQEYTVRLFPPLANRQLHSIWNVR